MFFVPLIHRPDVMLLDCLFYVLIFIPLTHRPEAFFDPVVFFSASRRTLGRVMLSARCVVTRDLSTMALMFCAMPWIIARRSMGWTSSFHLSAADRIGLDHLLHLIRCPYQLVLD